MKILSTIVLIFVESAASATDLVERREHIRNMENKVTVESSERKIRSERLLKELNVPTISHLPVIVDSSVALKRSKEEIALRAMTLLIVAVKAEGLEQEIVEKLIKDYELSNELTPKEKKFTDNPSPSQFDKTQFIWRYESAWVLLWALGYVQVLSPPTQICDVPRAVSFMQQRNRDQFIRDSKLRSISEILDETDLIYRYHWAVVDARVNGLQIPNEIDSSVVLERHYALNWLIGNIDQEWDDISTDT